MGCGEPSRARVRNQGVGRSERGALPIFRLRHRDSSLGQTGQDLRRRRARRGG
jgi:hypothetical protein